MQWLPDVQSHDLQIWLTDQLQKLCSANHKNKMFCCENGVIGAILVVLGREKQINPTAIGEY